MDPKKQALNPELKQIYERVMNTQIKPLPGDATPTTAALATGATTLATPAAPTDANKPPAAAAPPIPNPPAAIGTVPGATAPSVPPKPLGTTNNGFVFSGNKMKPAQGAQPTAGAKPAGRKIPMPVIMVGIVVFIVIWGVVWAKVLGLI